MVNCLLKYSIYMYVHSHGDHPHTAHPLQRMDKYSHDEGRDAHSRKLSNPFRKLNQRQGRFQLCSTEEERNKLKPIADVNTTQEQMVQSGPPYCDINKPGQWSDDGGLQFSPGREEGKSACLHPVNDLTGYLASERNSKGHSYHSVPIQKRETVA